MLLACLCFIQRKRSRPDQSRDLNTLARSDPVTAETITFEIARSRSPMTISISMSDDDLDDDDCAVIRSTIILCHDNTIATIIRAIISFKTARCRCRYLPIDSPKHLYLFNFDHFHLTPTIPLSQIWDAKS